MKKIREREKRAKENEMKQCWYYTVNDSTRFTFFNYEKQTKKKEFMSSFFVSEKSAFNFIISGKM